MSPEIETLKKWIYSSDNIVFFGGAGTSTESGIPDFRSPGGVYDVVGPNVGMSTDTPTYSPTNR